MRHIKVFESWEQTVIDYAKDYKMTPEQFQKVVDHTMQTKSPADAMRSLKKFIDDNPHLKKDPTVMKVLAPLVNSLTDDDKGVLKNDFETQNKAALDKKHPISLEDWRALIQGLSALPKSMAAEVGSKVLNQAIEAMPTLKKDASYMQELRVFIEVLRSATE